MAHNHQAVEVLHYVTPFAVALYYVIATAVGICMLQSSTHDGKSPHTAILVVMFVVMVTYICEDGIILSQLSAADNPLATTDSNIYVLASLLVWFVLTATLLTSESYLWYPYCGSWLITLFSEILVVSLNLSHFHPSSRHQYAQIALGALRMILLVCLPALTLFYLRPKNSEPHNDEESVSLLKHAQEISPESQKSAGSYGSTATCVTTGTISTTAEGADRLAQEEDKKDREGRQRVQKRLKETGNWWAYAKSYSLFFRYIWPTRKYRLQVNMVGVGMCIAALRVLNVLVPRQLGILVNSLGHTGISRPFVELSIYICLASLESHAGVSALKTYLWLPVEIYAHQSIDSASYDHIMSLSCDFHDNKQSGELYTAMSQGRSVIELLETLLYELAPMLIDLIVACIFVYYLFDAYMVLIVTSTMIVYLWVSLYLTVLQTNARRHHLVASRRAWQVLYDTMGGWRTVQYFNRLRHASGIYSASVYARMEARRRYHMTFYISDGMQGLILDFGLYGACFYAVYQVIRGNSNVGQFVTLFTYWANLAGPLNTLSAAHRHSLENLVDAEQLLELFQTKPTIADGPDRLRLENAEIDFSHVKFSYDGNKTIINDMSFHVEAGQTIALIGETGGGKSTILKLLFRFYDITEGSILIDGQDIRGVTVESLREHIGVVPQDPSLFNDTIMNNVRYAKLDATPEEVMEACRAAAIHDKIETFTNKYDSKVGENGVKLSGGELQRVAIARAILKNPKIILLDEATSSVDSETESKIQKALDTLSRGRTTFVVAHRLSTVVDADLILVIKDGTILEQGPPAELLKSKGKYYHLWAKQMGIQIGTEDAEDQIENADSKVDGLDRTGNEDGPGDSGPSSASGSEVPPNEADVSTKKAKRPTPRKVSNSKYKVSTALGRKIFRPDAPEFVPRYQRSTTASGSQEAHQHHHEAASGKVTEKDGISDKGKVQRPRKRKPKQNDSTATVNSAFTDVINGDGSNDTQQQPIDKQDSEQKDKKPRNNRRQQAKSEPLNQEQLQNQADGASELAGVATESSESRPMRNLSRRVTAPSDPPSGPSILPSGTSSQRRRSRHRHWKAKNREASANSGTQDSAIGQSWTSDVPSVGPPTAPFTSPAGGATPMNELAQEPNSSIRFAPGT
ncbi:hypothetical protein MMC13_002476 [Lambiella insularis]|nr:hypothetical protein [Lambiella insularis]